MRIGTGPALVLLLLSSCRPPDVPTVYDPVAIDKVGEKDANGQELHRYVQVEGCLVLPSKILALYGRTSVVLQESAAGGPKIETSIWVDKKEGKNRLVMKADMYDARTLKIADKDGALLSFGDPVVIRGSVRRSVSNEGTHYIDVDEILKGPPR